MHRLRLAFSAISFTLLGTIIPFVTIFFSACQSAPSQPAPMVDTSVAKSPNTAMFKPNPEFRTDVKKKPVAEYRVRTENRLNEMFFSVRLYETRVTMKYLAKVEFEGLTGEDTIKLPDVGTEPHPVLQKGPEKYSCIIGLLDNDQHFRELKKVYMTDKGQELKITTLKHYVVTQNYQLVGQ